MASNCGTALTLFLPILNKEEEDYTVVPDPMGFCYRLCSRVRESKEPIKQVIAEFVSQTHAEYICDASTKNVCQDVTQAVTSEANLITGFP